jgi:hypothetical protein
MLRDPRSDAMSDGAVDSFGAPGAGIDVTMPASLVALAPDIDLQSLQLAAPKCESVR